MSDEEKIDEFLELLNKKRDERIELLPEATTFVDVIADAMNALQIAYVAVNMVASPSGQTPQGAVFTPVSNPKDAKQL